MPNLSFADTTLVYEDTSVDFDLSLNYENVGVFFNEDLQTYEFRYSSEHYSYVSYRTHAGTECKLYCSLEFLQSFSRACGGCNSTDMPDLLILERVEQEGLQSVDKIERWWLVTSLRSPTVVVRFLRRLNRWQLSKLPHLRGETSAGTDKNCRRYEIVVEENTKVSDEDFAALKAKFNAPTSCRISANVNTANKL